MRPLDDSDGVPWDDGPSFLSDGIVDTFNNSQFYSTTSDDFPLLYAGGSASTLWPLLDENSSFGYENESVAYENSNQFILPLWRQVFWSVIFFVMIVVATAGNLIVIWIVLTHKRMRTVTNYFLVNLSIADTMVSLLNVTFNYWYMLNSHWPFGWLYCKISQFIAVVTISASVFTLMAISIDRYMAIINPLKPRMGKRATLCTALAIWAFSAGLSTPGLLFYTTYTENFTNGEVRVICYANWPDVDAEGHSLAEYCYNVAYMVFTYFMPIIAMGFTYCRIGFELWGSQSIGEATARQLENIKNKRRVVKMMMVVVMIFGVCWLPFHIYFIVISLWPDLTNESYIQEVYLFIYWLAMSNSMYNPIIYYWMNTRFRKGFAQVFSWLPCVKVSEEPQLTRTDAVSRCSYAGSPDTRARLSRNGTARPVLHLQETTTTLAIGGLTSRRSSFVDNNNGSGENGLSGHQRRFGYRNRLPFGARFHRLESQPPAESCS